MADISTTQAGETAEEIILTVSRPAAYYLRETSKWAYFLSIMGFILSGLIVLIALFAGAILSAMPAFQESQGKSLPPGFGFLISVMYTIMGAIYFVPSWYLLRYARKLKSALASKDSKELTAAFENEKSLYKFWGVFTIVMIAIYAVMLILLVIASIIAGSRTESTLQG